MTTHTATLNQRVNKVTDSASKVVADSASKAADAFNATVDYVRESSTSDMWDDAQEYVRAHPAQALLAAAAAGFIAARLLRRS